MRRFKFRRFFTILFLLIIKNLIIITIVLSSTRLQSYIAEKCIEFFADAYKIELSVGGVYLEIPNKVVLTDVEMKDSCGNNLLSADEFGASIKDFSLRNNFIILSEINLNKPLINANIDENGVGNYEYVLRKFATTDTSKININLICEKLTIDNGNLKFYDKRIVKTTNSFNISDFDISNFDVELSNFRYIRDTIKVNLDKFSLDEKSGIAINEISAKAKYYNKGIELKNLKIRSNYSEIACSEISVSSKDSLYLTAPIQKIENLNIKLDTVIFCVADLSPFIPEYENFTDSIHLCGDFSGKLSNFKFRNFGISAGDNTKFHANLSVNGFPDIEQTIIFGNIGNLTTTKNDINKILRFVLPQKPIQLPAILDNLDNISFNGNITGMLNDMVAYGKLTSNLGTIKTDIAIMPDWENKSLAYDGKISANNFNLKNIIAGENLFGLVSLEVKVNGSLDSLANTKNNIVGNINRFDFNNYPLSDINIKSNLTNKSVDVNLKIDDTNLKAQLLGNYNFEKKEQKIEVSSDIYANLKALDLVPEDSDSAEIKFVLAANLKGNLANRPIGEITLSQAKYSRNANILKINKLDISCAEESKTKYGISSKSDFMDFDVFGNYNISEIVPDVYNMIKDIGSKIVENETNAKKNNNNSYFNFSFRIKRINEWINFIDPELTVNGDIYTNNGYVFCDSKTIYGKIFIPQINRGKYVISNSDIELSCMNGKANLFYKINNLNTQWRNFGKVNLTVGMENDSLGMNINWSGNETSGFFELDTKFISQPNDSQPRIEAKIFPSQFVFGESVWKLSQTNINYQNKEVEIDNFTLANANQSLNIKGYISENPEKVLMFLVENVNVGNINAITNTKGYEFGGILSGSGRIANIYQVPLFSANINIDDLSINQENFGRFNISSKWDNQNKSLIVGATNKYLELKGLYQTEKDSVDATVMLKNLKLDIFDKYLNAYQISGLKGDANGNVTIGGSIKKPQLSGSISLKQTEFVYDYLKLKAITEDKVFIESDKIFFNNFKVKDDNGQTGTINGGIYHNNFSDFRFDLSLNLDDYKVLNTKLSDNNLFYGTVYATGGLTFDGTPDNFSIYAGATTEAGSRFVLPMEDSYKAQNTNFMTFVTPENQISDTIIETTLPNSSKYTIKLDVGITPDAEVQIVFDPRTGDRIKAFGKGMLKIEYNSEEELYLYGEIEVEKGDYLFTLENIINKRFTITPGSTITWTGNPYEGKLNIDAVYSANVSLKELMHEEYDTTDQYNMKTNVECHMHLNGNLLSPEIQFSINIPNATDKIKTKLASLTQDEINKQLLYVLVLNQFYDQNAELLNQTGTTTNALGVTTTEMLSNQLSNWLSKISGDVDVGFKYTPGTELSGQEIELALSTQIFNDRLLINGNLGISDKKYNNENLVGDFEVQWKLNKKGTLRLKGFTRKNTDLESEYGPYTTGAGIFYTEEFDTFKELVQKIWDGITFKDARERRKEKKEAKKIRDE